MPSERDTVLLQSLAPYYTTVTTAAVTAYWALLSVAPATSGGTISGEVTTGGYARQQVALTTPTFNAAAGAWEISNSAAITFGPFTADVLPKATYVALIKGAGGTASYWWPITATVLNGDSLYFVSQSLIIRSGDA